MRIPQTLTCIILLTLLQGCCWPQSAYPTYSAKEINRDLPPDGTFRHRAQTEVYDAARKINKAK